MDSEAYKEFCVAPFALVFLDPLYAERASMPGAASMGPPTEAFLFLSFMDVGQNDRLWQVSGFIPDPGNYDPLLAKIAFATTGESLSGGTDALGFTPESSTSGGDLLLARTFTAGDVISDAVFTSDTQATMLYQQVSGTSAVNVQGEFSQDGYLGFRVENQCARELLLRLAEYHERGDISC